MSSTHQHTTEQTKHHLPSEDIEKTGVYEESAHDFNVSEGIGPHGIQSSTAQPVVREEIIATETTTYAGAPTTGETTTTGTTGETTTTPRKPGIGAKIKGLFTSKHQKERELAGTTTTGESSTTTTHEKKGLFSGMKRKHHPHEKKLHTTQPVSETQYEERHAAEPTGVLGSSGAPDIVTPTEEGVLGGTGIGFEETDVSSAQLERPAAGKTWTGATTTTAENRAAPVLGTESYTIVDEPIEGVTTRSDLTGEGRTGWTGTTTTEEKATLPTRTTAEKDLTGAGWTSTGLTGAPHYTTGISGSTTASTGIPLKGTKAEEATLPTRTTAEKDLTGAGWTSTGLTGTPLKGAGAGTLREGETITQEEPGTLSSSAEGAVPTSEGSHVTRTVKRSSSPIVLHFESEPIVHSQEEFDKLPKERRIDVQQLLREQHKSGVTTTKEGDVPPATGSELAE